jgi:hypothetical protein
MSPSECEKADKDPTHRPTALYAPIYNGFVQYVVTFWRDPVALVRAGAVTCKSSVLLCPFQVVQLQVSKRLSVLYISHPRTLDLHRRSRTSASFSLKSFSASVHTRAVCRSGNCRSEGSRSLLNCSRTPLLATTSASGRSISPIEGYAVPVRVSQLFLQTPIIEQKKDIRKFDRRTSC